MAHRTRTLAAVGTFALAWTLAGCITINPVAPGTGTGAGGTKPLTSANAPATGAKRTPAPAGKPRAGTAETLTKLKSQGKVQVQFRGLGGPDRRSLKATTADIARVEVTLTDAAGNVQVQAVDREQMMAPVVSVFFERVPVGGATLSVTVYDHGGAQIGQEQQGCDVVGGKTTELGMTVRLGSTGGVGAIIDFEETEINAANVTGHWYVGSGGTPPDYPLTGCGNEGYIWYVNQYDNSIHASVSGYNGPEVADHPNMWWSEEAYGTIHGNEIKLQGRITYTDENGNMAAPPEEADYALTLDQARWQLVGTRNGQPGWAAPYYFDPNCGMATPPPIWPGWGPPTPMPSWAPSAMPSGYWGLDVDLRGMVYTSEGTPARDGTVTLTSYDDARPYAGTAAINPDGSFAFAGVPSGVELSITADVPNGPYGHESAYHWQAFYNYGNGQPETLDLWSYSTASPDPGPSPSCVPTTYPTIGAGGKPITWSTCEPVYEPIDYPTYGPSYYPSTPGPSYPPSAYPSYGPYMPYTPPPSAYASTPGPSWMPTPAPSYRP